MLKRGTGMCDLDQFRGKRALVFGSPRPDAWLNDILTTALLSIGPSHERWLDGGNRSWDALFGPGRYEQFVLVHHRSRNYAEGIAKAKAAGVPVLRVRRDGSVEVDEP